MTLLVAMVLSRVSEPAVADRVREQIDAQFANSAAPTQTMVLNAYMRRAVTQLGNIRMLIIGVMAISFFTMLLITASTMGQSVRERAGALAVMKTLGFTNLSICTLVLSEALLMCLVGALLAFLLVAQISAISAQHGTNILPLALAHLLTTSTVLIAACTICACFLPLQHVWRESIAAGLPHE